MSCCAFAVFARGDQTIPAIGIDDEEQCRTNVRRHEARILFCVQSENQVLKLTEKKNKNVNNKRCDAI